LPDFNPNVLKIKESPTRRIDSIRERLVREGKDIILLSAGQPGFPPPRELREKLAKKLIEDESMKLYGYTPTSGLIELRELIADDIKELGGPRLTPDQILITAGGQAAMFSVLSSILKPGDKVVHFDPTYFGYQPLIEYLGGKILWVPTDNEYQPDIENLKEVLERESAKAIIVVTPDNPTGRIIDEKHAKALSDLAIDHDLWLIVDEAYKTLIFEGKHYWLYNYAPENVVAIDVFSKDPGIPGWRLGFVYSNEELIKRAKLVLQEIVYCPPSIAQHFVITYLKDRKLKGLTRERLLEKLKVRRDKMMESIERYLPEATMIKPKGGMFLFADLEYYLKRLKMDSEEFSKLLLERKYVASVPGSYFGPTQKYTLRLSFSVESPERIEEGIKRMKELIDELQYRMPSS